MLVFRCICLYIYIERERERLSLYHIRDGVVIGLGEVFFILYFSLFFFSKCFAFVVPQIFENNLLSRVDSCFFRHYFFFFKRRVPFFDVYSWLENIYIVGNKLQSFFASFLPE